MNCLKLIFLLKKLWTDQFEFDRQPPTSLTNHCQTACNSIMDFFYQRYGHSSIYYRLFGWHSFLKKQDAEITNDIQNI